MKDNKYIVLQPVGLLTDQIRTIISFKILADYLDVSYYVYIQNWFDYFINDNLFTSINAAEWESFRSNSFKLDENYQHILSEDVITTVSLEDIYNGKYDKISVITSKDLGKVTESLVYKIPDYNDKYEKLFNSLVLADSLYNEVASIKNTLDLTNTIGIYIHRVFDDVALKHKDEYYQTSDEYFDDKIKNAGTKKIFLVSDSQEYLDKYSSLSNVIPYLVYDMPTTLKALWILRSLKETYLNSYTSLGRYGEIKINRKKINITTNEYLINYLISKFNFINT